MKYLNDVREQHPLKQGLKPRIRQTKGDAKTVREQHPLKQGLKLYRHQLYILKYLVREQHPLKQGLKRRSSYNVVSENTRSRATSIKTRIEI